MIRNVLHLSGRMLLILIKLHTDKLADSSKYTARSGANGLMSLTPPQTVKKIGLAKSELYQITLKKLGRSSIAVKKVW